MAGCSYQVCLSTRAARQFLLQIPVSSTCLFDTHGSHMWFILQQNLVRVSGKEHITWCDQRSEQGQHTQNFEHNSD